MAVLWRVAVRATTGTMRLLWAKPTGSTKIRAKSSIMLAAGGNVAVPLRSDSQAGVASATGALTER